MDRANHGLLLGAVIDRIGVNAVEHVNRRSKMVENAISQIKRWRTRGLPYDVVYKHLFMAKLLPRFSYIFGLLHLGNWGKMHDKIRKTLDKALCATFGWKIPRGAKKTLSR